MFGDDLLNDLAWVVHNSKSRGAFAIGRQDLYTNSVLEGERDNNNNRARK